MAIAWLRSTSIVRRDGFESIPLAAIIGIVVGATLVFSSVVGTLIVVYCLRKKHGQNARRTSTSSNLGQAEMDIKTALRCTHPPECRPSNRHPNNPERRPSTRNPNNPERRPSNRISNNPFMPLGDQNLGPEWADREVPQPTKAKRTMSQRSFFRVSVVRDSWPLASNNLIPLAILPNQSTMVLSPVAPPGYIIEDRGPNRSSSRLSRRKSAISVDTTRSQSPKITRRRGSAGTTSPSHSPSKSPKRSPRRSAVRDMFGSPTAPLKRRATSETQLSTILRSTSQRLKASHRQSLIRTLTTIGIYPGPPPPTRLPTPPRGLKVTESREELIDREYSESLRGSFLDCYTNRTPSPDKDVKVTFDEPNYQPQSPTTSSTSGDSLCIRKKVDVVVPTSLNSPSKSLQGQKRRKVGVQSDIVSENDSPMALKDLRIVIPAAKATSLPKSGSSFDPSMPISFSNDPFYSSWQSSDSVIPPARVQGPRPMFRKATFGDTLLSQPPIGSYNPLKESTGNVQSQPKQRSFSPVSSPERSADSNQTEPNLFQWSPQESSPRSRPGSTSPTHAANRRRGHKRSNVVRISTNLKAPSRPPSIIESIDEENVQPVLKFNIPKSVARLSAPPKSPTPSPSTISNRKLATRPPSLLKFEPILTIPDLSPRSIDISPMLGQEDVRSDGFYSSAYNSEEGRGCGPSDQFFNTRPLTLTKSPASGQTYSEIFAKSGERQNHGRNRSSILIYPDHDTQRGQEDVFVSFPPPRLADHLTPVLSPPVNGARSLPNITTSMPALSLLTTTISPQLGASDIVLDRTHLLAESSPPRTSLHASINLLRRMNSDVSTQCSTLSVHCMDESPGSFPNSRSHTPLPELKEATVFQSEETAIEAIELERGRSRGSKHYLAISSQYQFDPARISSLQNVTQMPVSNSRHSRNRERSHTRQPRDSHRVHKERSRKNFGADAENETDDSDNMLTPHRDRRGARGMDWEYDGTDRAAGVSDWDTELTPVREVSSPSTDKRSKRKSVVVPETLSNSNALGIMGLGRYPTMDFETDKADIHGGIDGVTPYDLHRELTSAKRDLSTSPSKRGKGVGKSALGFGFEAFRPALNRAPSLRLSGPVDAISEKTGDENSGASWNDKMAKPNANATRRESKMENPVPQGRWSFSSMSSAVINAATVRLIGGNSQRVSVIDPSGNVIEETGANATPAKAFKKIEKTMRPESLGLYDQDGFLRSSPGQKVDLKENKRKDSEVVVVEGKGDGAVDRDMVRSETKMINGYVM